MSLDQGLRYTSGFNYHNQYLPQDPYGAQLHTSSFQVREQFCESGDINHFILEWKSWTEPEQAAEWS